MNKDFFNNIDNEVLDGIMMSSTHLINSEEYRKYYTEKSSKEHYRLLTYLSENINNITILDIGTLKGCSALALSKNKTNKVFSFNLGDQLDLSEKPDNIEFIIDNVINGKYDDIIIRSPIILLDTYHDGTFEREFVEYLLKIKYSGTLILDDIFLNVEMKSFWGDIILEKLNITHLGHASGTGVVFFK